MNFLKQLWENVGTRFLAVLTILWLLYRLCRETGVFSLAGSGAYGLTMLLSTAGIITALTYLYEIRTTESISSDPDNSNISKRLRERTGTVFSQLTSERRFIDFNHEYLLLHRQDLLDYKSKHFNSFRHIKGINKSRTVSDGLIYCESTEYKIPFSETRIEALDLSTDPPTQLRVESLKDVHERYITHAFKIHFRQQLRPQETFDIGYSIFLPNELQCLDPDHELMSISLVRIKRPVKELIFNVALDFNPRAFKVYEKSALTGRMKLIDSADINSEHYTPTTELELAFDIKWSCAQPYIIRWKILSPPGKLYVIEYVR
jgi:hypothetical protein